MRLAMCAAIVVGASGRAAADCPPFPLPLPTKFLISPGFSQPPGPVIDTLTPALMWLPSESFSLGGLSYRVSLGPLFGGPPVPPFPNVIPAGFQTILVVPEGTLQPGVTYVWNVTTINPDFGCGSSFPSMSMYFTTPSRIMSLSGTMDFGGAQRGSTVSRTLTIANSGNSELGVGPIEYPVGFSGDWGGGPIAAGASRDVNVKFTPPAAGSFGGTITVNSNQTSGANMIDVFGTGMPVQNDFDGGGTSDLIWRNTASGQNVVWLMDSMTVAFSAFGPTIADSNWEARATGDFDGDAKADIIWRNKATGANLVWLMDAPTTANAVFLPTIADTNWAIAGAGDFDGDARADVLLRHQLTGENVVWLMNGAEVVFSAFLPTIPDPGWEVRGVGDVDADARSDVLWRNKVSGENLVWQMDGMIATETVLPSLVDTNWEIVGVGDLDGDSKADVIFRNTVNGEDAAWLMDGAAVASAEPLATIANTNWEIKAIGDRDGDGMADIIWRNTDDRPERRLADVRPEHFDGGAAPHDRRCQLAYRGAVTSFL